MTKKWNKADLPWAYDGSQKYLACPMCLIQAGPLIDMGRGLGGHWKSIPVMGQGGTSYFECQWCGEEFMLNSHETDPNDIVLTLL